MMYALRLITFNCGLMHVILINDLLAYYGVRSRLAAKGPFNNIININNNNNNNNGNASNATTENPFLGRNDSNQFWLEALRDIAYYLRGHKFNEYDRRYQKDASKAPREYHAYFPRPPLRSLHWEVNKYCEQSFVTCVEYLHARIRKTDLRRLDDTAVVIVQQNWTMATDRVQIDTVERECKKMMENGEKFVNPFEGPLERFQWRATASYFMCWYTMNEVRDLMHFGESCDNFAACLDGNNARRPQNEDARASDDASFGCAAYSFCPDPCCPVRHLKEAAACLDVPENPCFEENAIGRRECAMKRQENRDLTDIILNRWNVTCRCPAKGFVWESRYGICVDVDECLTGVHGCDPLREACVNLVGTYECVCRWGYHEEAAGKGEKRCEASAALTALKLNKRRKNGTRAELAESLVKKVVRLIFGHRASASSPTATVDVYVFAPYVLFLIIP